MMAETEFSKRRIFISRFAISTLESRYWQNI